MLTNYMCPAYHVLSMSYSPCNCLHLNMQRQHLGDMSFACYVDIMLDHEDRALVQYVDVHTLLIVLNEM